MTTLKIIIIIIKNYELDMFRYTVANELHEESFKSP